VSIDILHTLCADKIKVFVDRIIDDNYVINDPQEGRTYWRDYRLGLFNYGPMTPTILGLLMLAWKVTGDIKYKKEWNKYIRHGAHLQCIIPFFRLFEIDDDFSHNITIMSLVAYWNISSKSRNIIKKGISWELWMLKKVYNPYWIFLKKYVEQENNNDFNFKTAKYMLSTIDNKNFNNACVDASNFNNIFSSVDTIEIKKYFRFFGKKITTLPPKYSDKLSDVFMFQRIEREATSCGLKTNELRTNENYNMIDYLITYELMRLVSK
jgi:hypothetical protein